MANQSVFIESAYEEAIKYANKTINLSEKVGEDYTERDAFFYDIKTKDYALAICCIVFGIVALAFKGVLWQFLSENLFSKMAIGVLSSFLSMIYAVGFILVILFGAWEAFKVIYAKKTKEELKELKQVCGQLEEEKELAQGIKNTVLKAIADFQYVQVENPNLFEEKIAVYQVKADEIGPKTRKIGKWVGIIGSVLSVVIFLVLFNPFIVNFISGSFTYCGTLVVCSSYLLLMGLIYRSQMILTVYMKKFAKYVGIALFALYQLVLCLQLKSTAAFTPLIYLSGYAQGGNPEWLATIVVFAFKYLINEGVIVMLVVSVIGFMSLVRTDVEREYLAKKDGIDIPLDNGSSRHVEAQNRWKSIGLATAFILIAPFLMSGILNKEATFGSVILYILLGLAWFGISTTFTGDDAKAIYGKRLGWVKNSFFFSYIFLSLSLVPRFGFGSVFLLLVQPIISLIAFFALITFI